MTFSKTGESFRVSRISGPTHNLLGLRFGSLVQGKLETIEFPPVGGCAHAPLDRDAIVAAVARGIDRVNHEQKSDLRLARIEYVSDDTGPESVYESLAMAIAE